MKPIDAWSHGETRGKETHRERETYGAEENDVLMCAVVLHVFVHVAVNLVVLVVPL